MTSNSTCYTPNAGKFISKDYSVIVFQVNNLFILGRGESPPSWGREFALDISIKDVRQWLGEEVFGRKGRRGIPEGNEGYKDFKIVFQRFSVAKSLFFILRGEWEYE